MERLRGRHGMAKHGEAWRGIARGDDCRAAVKKLDAFPSPSLSTSSLLLQKATKAPSKSSRRSFSFLASPFTNIARVSTRAKGLCIDIVFANAESRLHTSLHNTHDNLCRMR